MDEAVLCDRGTTVAVYDYASALKRHHGIDPVILYDAARDPDLRVLEHFRRTLDIRPYRGADDRSRLVREIAPSHYYYLKVRKRDIRAFGGVDTIAHSIFDFVPDDQVSRFAYVSQWLSDHVSGGSVPVVPHIVSLPAVSRDLRPAWGIPPDAPVIGRYGAYDSFDVPFVPDCVRRVVERRTDLWFVFVNTRPFTDHPRIKFLPGVVELGDKADFIAACDAMLHSRYKGESFGLAMAEFLFMGKPVLCWGGGADRHHLRLQPDPSNVYRTAAELDAMLMRKDLVGDPGRCRAAVAAFSPEQVAQRFVAEFLTPRSPVRLSAVARAWASTRKTMLKDRSRLRNVLYKRGLVPGRF